MTISINSKRTPPPPPQQGTFNRRLTQAGALIAVFAASLLLTACPSPGGGGGTSAENNCTGPEPTGTARYSITQTASGTPGTPGTPGVIAPTPATPGSYKLTVVNCVRTIGNNEFASNGTIIRNAAAAEGIAGSAASRMITEIALPSTLRSIGENGFALHFGISGTLTIPRNVETIAKNAFRNTGFSTAAPTVVFETGSRLTTIGNNGFQQSFLKNFTLPTNLETIEAFAFFTSQFSFSADFSPSDTLIIPAKVSKIGAQAFAHVTGITALDIRSDRLRKPDGATANFPLGNSLFQGVSGITEIKLPQAVYDSYTKAQLQAIFGSTFVNYRKPDGTAYDFAGKS